MARKSAHMTGGLTSQSNAYAMTPHSSCCRSYRHGGRCYGRGGTDMGGTEGRTLRPSSLAQRARVEHVAQRIAEQVDRQDEAEQRDRGGAEVPPHDRIARELVARLIDHLPPAAGDADAEPRQ